MFSGATLPTFMRQMKPRRDPMHIRMDAKWEAKIFGIIYDRENADKISTDEKPRKIYTTNKIFNKKKHYFFKIILTKNLNQKKIWARKKINGKYFE